MSTERIEKIAIEQAIGERFGEYSKYIIQDRALPDVRDGLKPVQRRILYGMFIEGNVHNKAQRKSARAVGDVMGKYHPHGDSSIYMALARMSQDWIMGIPLIDMQGNNGAIDGDAPAAMRYTESRTHKIVDEAMLAGIRKKGIVEMRKTFDDTREEPVVLPVHYPNLLVQGSTGISAGYATDSFPHNLAETLKGAIALLEDDTITLEELVTLIPAPDLPTGAVIVGARTMVDVYRTGKGRIQVRAKYRIEEDKKRTYVIIEEIPYAVKKRNLIEALDAVVGDKKVEGLIASADESDRHGLRIVITLAKDADVNVVLGYLFKHTPLQNNLNMNNVVIKDKKPVQLGLREVLVEFNKFRLETRRNELEYDQRKLEERLHLVEGFIKLTDIINEVINVIKEADGKDDARKQIEKAFGFTDLQSEAIVSMQLHRISKTDKDAYIEEEKKLTRLYKSVTALLTSKKKFVKSIIRDYEKIIEEYGTPRRTEVIMEDENWEVRKVDTVITEDTVVGVTKEGYLKRSTIRSHTSTTVPGLVEGDKQLFEGKATTKDFLIIVTNKLNYLYVPIHEIEEVRWGDTGKPLATYATLAEGEVIVNAFTVTEEDGDKYVLVVKSNGQVKRTLVSQHVVARRFWNTYMAIKPKADEEVLGAWLVEDEGYIGFADKAGRKMYFAVNEIPPKGIKTEGMRGIHMDEKNNEKVSAMKFSIKQTGMPKAYKYRARGQKGWA